MWTWVLSVLLGVLVGAGLTGLLMRRASRRSAAQLALRQADHDRLRVVAETAPSVIISYRLAPDGTWSYPFATERVRDVYGVSLEELSVERVAQRLHPDDLPVLARAVRASASSLEPWFCAFRIDHPSRGEVWVEGHAAPVRDADGGTTWHGTLTDVTERRRVEARLAAREQLLAQMGEIAGVGGWEFNLQTGQAQWTDEVGPMFGMQRGVTADPPAATALLTPESRAAIGTALSRAAEGEAYDLELELRTPDGESRWLRTIGRPVVDEGSITRVRGALLDITAQKRNEADRLERTALQERLARLAESAPGAMFAYRADSDGRGAFTVATSQLASLFGVPLDLARQDAAHAFARIEDDDRERLTSSLRRSADGLSLWREDFRVRHPERGVIRVEARAAPTRQPDGAIVWHGFFVDVTEHKLLEEQLRQSQKMEAIGQLAGGVAHDFNNMLTVILGNASLLTERPLPAAALAEAREIASAAERSAALTRQLLMFSRREVMYPVNLDVNEVVGSMTRMLERLLGEPITVQANLASGLPPVRADVGMMEQVVLNLALNARDAMPQGGTLTISTALGRVEPAAPGDSGDRVVITVRDTGCGMSPGVQARIFEPFFTTKEPGKGTGLGLATVYGIVRQHGGTIEVASAPGFGATFDVVLPVSGGSVAVAAAPPASSETAGAGATVLLVEDEPSVRLLTSAVLEQAGYRVVTAPSGKAALQVWQDQAGVIDVLMTDIVMPDGMTGPELARRLLAMDPHLPVVYVSGYSSETTAASLPLQDGVNFLQKPYQLQALTSMVAGAVARRRASRAS